MEYTRDYSIYTPQLKSQGGRRPRFNPKLGNFTYGFDPRVLDKFGLNAVSFCFFILWERGLQGELNKDAFWFKKELSVHDGGTVNIKDRSCFDKKFFDDEPLELVKRKQRFFAKYGLSSSYFVAKDLKEDFDLAAGQNVAIQVTYDEARDRLVKQVMTLGELQALLVRHSNKEMKTVKGLHYYETDLEKYLQETCKDTGALFPGDCDMLLYDDHDVCRYIVEFKKRTARDPIPLEEQSIVNYLKRDRNKYTRLDILRNYFSPAEGRTVPLITVFYSVVEGEDKLKLEVIEPSLAVGNTCIFEIGPEPAANQELLLRKMIALCQ